MPPYTTHAPRSRSIRPISYPRSAFPVWMPMPTTSPLAMVSMSTGSSVLSMRWGSPHAVPVAAARTYNHRGVMTATPKDRLLGLIKWTRGGKDTSQGKLQYHTVSQHLAGGNLPSGGRGGERNSMAHRSRPTTNKRQREQARIAKRNDKAARFADRAKRTADRGDLPPGVDPDIADIRPGPQPLADWQIEAEPEEEEKEV